MPSLRIDNLSGDTFTVFIDGEEFSVLEDEKLTVENVDRGTHTLIIHRTRIPQNITDNSEVLKENGSEFYQLDGAFEIDISSGKCVAAVKKDVSAHNKIGLNAVFSGYKIEMSGGKLISTDAAFANTEMRKRFSKNQLKEAFIPVGIGALIFLVIAIYALYGIIGGTPVKISDRVMTLPWTLGAAAVSLGCFAYIIIVLLKSKRIENKYRQKKARSR